MHIFVCEKKNNLLVQAFLRYAKTIVYVVLSILSGPVYIGFAFDNVVKVEVPLKMLVSIL